MWNLWKQMKTTWFAGIRKTFISQVAPAKPQSHIMPRYQPGSAWYCNCACHRNMDIMKRDIMSEIGMLCAQLIFFIKFTHIAALLVPSPFSRLVSLQATTWSITSNVWMRWWSSCEMTHLGCKTLNAAWCYSRSACVSCVNSKIDVSMFLSLRWNVVLSC